MSRPSTVAEVVERTIFVPSSFAIEHDAFLDGFYLAHPRKNRQKAMLDPVPDATGDAFVDAWIGAVGEHLACRWDLTVPSWTRRACHDRLTVPRFVPGADAVRGMLIVTSPPAFRARLLFTVAEPLQRARFPRNHVALPVPIHVRR